MGRPGSDAVRFLVLVVIVSPVVEAGRDDELYGYCHEHSGVSRDVSCSLALRIDSRCKRAHLVDSTFSGNVGQLSLYGETSGQRRVS